jgi:hypothetical protein
MAVYNQAANLRFGNGPAFDYVYGPSQTVPLSGIYRCDGCGREIAANKGDPLPPQNHHQHPPLAGPVRWRPLVVTG